MANEGSAGRQMMNNEVAGCSESKQTKLIPVKDQTPASSTNSANRKRSASPEVYNKSPKCRKVVNTTVASGQDQHQRQTVASSNNDGEELGSLSDDAGKKDSSEEELDGRSEYHVPEQEQMEEGDDGEEDDGEEETPVSNGKNRGCQRNDKAANNRSVVREVPNTRDTNLQQSEVQSGRITDRPADTPSKNSKSTKQNQSSTVYSSARSRSPTPAAPKKRGRPKKNNKKRK